MYAECQYTGVIANLRQNREEEKCIASNDLATGEVGRAGPAKKSQGDTKVSCDTQSRESFGRRCGLAETDVKTVDMESSLEIEGKARAGIESPAEE